MQRRAHLCCSATSLLCSDEPSCAAQRRASCAATSLLCSDELSSAATSSLVRRRAFCCGDSGAATISLVRRRALWCGDEFRVSGAAVAMSSLTRRQALWSGDELSGAAMSRRRAPWSSDELCLWCGDKLIGPAISSHSCAASNEPFGTVVTSRALLVPRQPCSDGNDLLSTLSADDDCRS